MYGNQRLSPSQDRETLSRNERKRLIIERINRIEELHQLSVDENENKESSLCRDLPKRMRREKLIQKLNRIYDESHPHPPTQPRSNLNSARPNRSHGRNQKDLEEKRRQREIRKQEILQRLQKLNSENEADEMRSELAGDKHVNETEFEVDPLVANFQNLIQKRAMIDNLQQEIEQDQDEIRQLETRQWNEVKGVVPVKQSKMEKKKLLVATLKRNFEKEAEEIQKHSDELHKLQESEAAALSPELNALIHTMDENVPKWKRKQVILDQLREEYLISHPNEDGPPPQKGTKKYRKWALMNRLQKDLKEYEYQVCSSYEEQKMIRREQKIQKEDEEMADNDSDLKKYINSIPKNLSRKERKKLVIEKIQHDLDQTEKEIEEMQTKTWSEASKHIPNLNAKKTRKQEIINKLQKSLEEKEKALNQRMEHYKEQVEEQMSKMAAEIAIFVTTLEGLSPEQRDRMLISKMEEALEAATKANQIDDDISSDSDIEFEPRIISHLRPLPESNRPEELEDSPKYNRFRRPVQKDMEAPALVEADDIPRVRRLPVDKDQGSAPIMENVLPQVRKRPVSKDELVPQLPDGVPNAYRRPVHKDEFAVSLREIEGNARRKPVKKDEGAIHMMESEPHNLIRKPTYKDEYAVPLMEYERHNPRRNPVARGNSPMDLWEEEEQYNYRRQPALKDEAAAMLWEGEFITSKRRKPIARDEGAAGIRENDDYGVRRRPIDRDQGAAPMDEDITKQPYRRPILKDSNVDSLNELEDNYDDYRSAYRRPGAKDEGAVAIFEYENGYARRKPAIRDEGAPELEWNQKYNSRRAPIAHDEGAIAIPEYNDSNIRRKPIPQDERAAELLSPQQPRRAPVSRDEGAVDLPEYSDHITYRRPVPMDEIAAEEREPHESKRAPAPKDEKPAEMLSKRERKSSVLKNLNVMRNAFIQKLNAEISLIKDRSAQQANTTEPNKEDIPSQGISESLSEFLKQQQETQKAIQSKRDHKRQAKLEKWGSDPYYSGWLAWCEEFDLNHVSEEDPVLGLEAFKKMKEKESNQKKNKAHELSRSTKVISVQKHDVMEELERLAAEVASLEREEAEDANHGLITQEFDQRQEDELRTLEQELEEMEIEAEKEALKHKEKKKKKKHVYEPTKKLDPKATEKKREEELRNVVSRGGRVELPALPSISNKVHTRPQFTLQDNPQEIFSTNLWMKETH